VGEAPTDPRTGYHGHFAAKDVATLRRPVPLLGKPGLSSSAVHGVNQISLSFRIYLCEINAALTQLSRYAGKVHRRPVPGDLSHEQGSSRAVERAAVFERPEFLELDAVYALLDDLGVEG